MRKGIRFFSKFVSLTKARLGAYIFPGGVTAGYYNIKNFGDQLTPDFLKFFGFCPFHISVWRYADVVGVGSILHNLPSDYKGALLGSGFISEKSGKPFAHADCYLVRGHLTRKLLGKDASLPVGDPGLIADELYHDVIQETELRWDLGIVPHYVDKDHPDLLRLQGKNPNAIKIIDVDQPPVDVVKDIAECAHIASSSLHGLIVADSIGIPNKWMVISGNTIGGDFKFNDYYSCFHIKPRPIYLRDGKKPASLLRKTESINADLVTEIKEAIRNAVQSFAKTMS